MNKLEDAIIARLDQLSARVERLERILLPLKIADDVVIPGNRNPYSDPVLRTNWNRFVFDRNKKDGS